MSKEKQLRHNLGFWSETVKLIGMLQIVGGCIAFFILFMQSLPHDSWNDERPFDGVKFGVAASSLVWGVCVGSVLILVATYMSWRVESVVQHESSN
jgi:hypothetical protein